MQLWATFSLLLENSSFFFALRSSFFFSLQHDNLIKKALFYRLTSFPNHFYKQLFLRHFLCNGWGVAHRRVKPSWIGGYGCIYAQCRVKKIAVCEKTDVCTSTMRVVLASVAAWEFMLLLYLYAKTQYHDDGNACVRVSSAWRRMYKLSHAR